MIILVVMIQLQKIELVKMPWNKTTCNNGQLQRYAGFPVGCTSQSVDNSFQDQDWYTIRQWLGILGGNASTSIIDTSLNISKRGLKVQDAIPVLVRYLKYIWKYLAKYLVAGTPSYGL